MLEVAVCGAALEDGQGLVAGEPSMSALIISEVSLRGC